MKNQSNSGALTGFSYTAISSRRQISALLKHAKAAVCTRPGPALFACVVSQAFISATIATLIIYLTS